MIKATAAPMRCHSRSLFGTLNSYLGPLPERYKSSPEMCPFISNLPATKPSHSQNNNALLESYCSRSPSLGGCQPHCKLLLWSCICIITDDDAFVVHQGWWRLSMQHRQCKLLQFKWLDRDGLQPHGINLRGVRVLHPADCLLQRSHGEYIIL